VKTGPFLFRNDNQQGHFGALFYFDPYFLVGFTLAVWEGSSMRFLALVLFSVLVSSSAISATECPNFAGSFFYSHNPSQNLVIDQSACELTLTYSNSGAETGKPLKYFGDGEWRLSFEDDRTRETNMSLALTDSFVIETKTFEKRTGSTWHQRQTLKLRRGFDVVMEVWITDGKITDTGNILLIRK
jgi:hypothetical protein